MPAPKDPELPPDAPQPLPVPPPGQSPGDPPPELPHDPPYPYPPAPPSPPNPPGDPGKPWPPNYPPNPPEECEPPVFSHVTFTWYLEREERDAAGNWVWVHEADGPRDSPSDDTWSYTFNQPHHRGKRFRVSCVVKAYGVDPRTGGLVLCGKTTAYAFVRVKEGGLAVSLTASPEPAGVWQTIEITAKVQDCEEQGQEQGSYTYRWTFGDDPSKVVERQGRGSSDTVHYFYKQMHRYLVQVEVTKVVDGQVRRGSASMWIHVGLEVRLGMPMSICAPLRGYRDDGLADPNWTFENIRVADYLGANAPYQAQRVCVAIQNQTLPYECPRRTQQTDPTQPNYRRVDPLWGRLKLLEMLQSAGVSIRMGQVKVLVGNQSNEWGPQGVWWVPDGMYLWPEYVGINPDTRLPDPRYLYSSKATEACWWNYWTSNLLELNQQGVSLVGAEARLGWMRSWDLAAITVVGLTRTGGLDTPRLNNGLFWRVMTNPCWPGSQEPPQLPLLLSGAPGAGFLYPAFLMYTDIVVVHPWYGGDVWQKQIADSHHRAAIQVGAVQTVEGFSEGWMNYSQRRSIRYYLLDSDPCGPPPLLDTASCRGDRITHAWYADRGRPMWVYRNEIQQITGDSSVQQNYKSYWTLSESGVRTTENGWKVWVGWKDSPSLWVPPAEDIEEAQSSTPELQFYTAIAGRTYYFPFSYVSLSQTQKGWKIKFDGSVVLRSQNEIRYERNANGGAELRRPTPNRPETYYGPYNSCFDAKEEER